MRHVVISLLLVFILLLGVFTKSDAYALSGVVIDLGEEIGPSTHRASGFLWSVTSNQPPDDLIKPLKPRLFRCCLTPWDMEGVGLESAVRMNDIGARIQIMVSDEYAHHYGGYKKITHWPGDHGDFSLWDKVIEDTFNTATSKGLTAQYDIWEEPNWSGWWAASREQFFEAYAYAYRKLKALDGKAVIVGPSINKFQPDYLQAFLLYAKEHNVLPNILSWHEIIEQHTAVNIPDHVAAIRAFMKQHEIEIPHIDINEVISESRQTIPGMHVWYLAYLEEAKIHEACKASWKDDKLWNTARWPTLDGLLTYPELKPRSTWWVYKAYADITGTLVRVIPDKTMAGIAGVDRDDKTVRILLGRSGWGANDNGVRIKNINHLPWLAKDGRVRVTAKRIPNTGWNSLSAPISVMDRNLQVKGNELALQVPGFDRQEALILELTAP